MFGVHIQGPGGEYAPSNLWEIPAKAPVSVAQEMLRNPLSATLAGYLAVRNGETVEFNSASSETSSRQIGCVVDEQGIVTQEFMVEVHNPNIVQRALARVLRREPKAAVTFTRNSLVDRRPLSYRIEDGVQHAEGLVPLNKPKPATVEDIVNGNGSHAA